MSDVSRPTASALLREGFGLAVRPPFVWLVALGIFATLATAPIKTEDAGAFIGVIVVSIISFYAAIGLTLAAAEQAPDRSPEFWIRAALARRCLIRSLVALLFATVLVAAGLLALIVPGFIVGAAVALAESAAILENQRPGDSIRRSIELSKPARKPLGVVYGVLVIGPGATLQAVLYFLELDATWLVATLQCVTLALSSVSQIAMTKAFLDLGGRKLRREVPAPTPERRVP